MTPALPGLLRKILNEHARQGWRFKTMSAVDVKGRIGPGGTDWLLITFERGGD